MPSASVSLAPPAAPVASLGAPAYKPRDTQDSPLVRLLRQHLDEFVERTCGDDPDWRLPKFVEQQLRAMIACGDFTRGYVPPH